MVVVSQTTLNAKFAKSPFIKSRKLPAMRTLNAKPWCK